MKKIVQGGSLFFLLLISSLAWSQNKTVTGRIIGENGIGVSKASVLVQGTRIGVTTNERGEFTISVPSSATILVISSVGYGTVEEPINGRTAIEITLKPGVQEMQEVVVTALGLKREEKALG